MDKSDLGVTAKNGTQTAVNCFSLSGAEVNSLLSDAVTTNISKAKRFLRGKRGHF
jgi:hypothetical protein